MKNKVGIITMHKVLNYGSALQAYALQHKIENLGYESELIDYIYPNESNIPKKKNIIKSILGLYQKRYTKRKNNKFNQFYKDYFKLSPVRYKNNIEIHNNPPKYDIYITGSDQVWNIKHVKMDSSFLLSFAPDNAKKISYSSSFAQKELPMEFHEMYKKYLFRYNAISVREEAGCDIIQKIIKRNAIMCIDPTLLLNKEEWSEIAKTSNVQIGQSYILVYILDYAFNPYPFVTKLIRKIKKQYNNKKIVLLNFSNKQFVGKKNILNLHDSVGPNDFVNLFLNADLVITTSFHGIAFSLNFERPFYAIINNQKQGDDRLMNILKIFKAEKRAILKDSIINNLSIDMDYTNINKEIEKHRLSSNKFLFNNLE